MSSALFLEPIGGISGDLFLGAAADLGLDLDELTRLLKGAGLGGFTIEVDRAAEHGIHGSRVSVRVTELQSGSQGHLHARPGTHEHGHRAWREIREFLQTLPSEVATTALAIFGALARAEAQVHHVAIDDVEFHEVGAVDSIVDITGAAWALWRLGNPLVFTRPPPLGSGTVRSQHGVIPLPAPATLVLLAGKPTLLEGLGELTTPTGAAILVACAAFELPARFTPQRTGYGVGHLRFADRPNLLRATLGEIAANSNSNAVVVLEAHLDDSTPQLLGHLLDRLIAQGALDAALSPLLMKKGRLGHRLTVVCHDASRTALSELIFRESTTLGLRTYPVERDELARRHVEVDTRFGRLRVKLGLLRGEVVNVAPEYDDCVAAATAHGAPLKEVLAAALASVRL